MSGANLTYILNDALATEWMMTLEGCQALRQIYFDALQQKKSGSLRISDIETLWAKHEAEGLGQSMHMLREEDGRMALQTKPLEGSSYTSTFKNIAIIDIIGPIVPRVRGMSSGSVGAQQIRDDFIRAFESDDIKAILLNVDSPGGDARGISELAQTIQKTRNKNTKLIYAYAAGWMASAAYFISAASHRIVANDWASVGSIGVVIGVPPSLPDDNIEFVSTSSPYKRPNIATPEGRKVYQDKADYMGMLFIEAVADLRGVTTEKVINDFGQGNTLIGKQAKTAGLVDAIGTFDSTLHSLMTAKAPTGPVGTQSAETGTGERQSERMLAELGTSGLLLYKKAVDAGLAQPIAAFDEVIAQLAGSPNTKNLNKPSVLQDGADEEHDTSTTGVTDMAEKAADTKDTKPTNDAPPPKVDAKPADEKTETSAELETTKAELSQQRAANEAQAKEIADLKTSVANLEKQNRETRFKAMSKEWAGNHDHHMAMLEQLSQLEGGEQSDLFKNYLAEQSAVAAQMKESALFKEIGSSTAAEGSVQAEWEAAAQKLQAESAGKITIEQARDQVWTGNADLRKRYNAEVNQALGG